jgi:hypothetical protein
MVALITPILNDGWLNFLFCLAEKNNCHPTPLCQAIQALMLNEAHYMSASAQEPQEQQFAKLWNLGVGKNGYQKSAYHPGYHRSHQHWQAR